MNSADSSSRDSSPDFAALQSRSRSRNLIIGVIVLVLVGGGIAYASHAAEADAKEKQLSAAARLRACLLVAPLEDDESPVLRFRRLQLQSMTVSDADVEVQRADTWPLACHDEIIALKEIFKEAKVDEMVQALDTLGKFVGSTDARHKDPSKILPTSLEVLDRLAPGPIPQAEAPLPPRVLNADALKNVPPLSKHGTALSRTYTEDNPGAELPVLITEESLQAPLLCIFKNTAGAQCEDLTGLSKVKGQGLRLLGTSSTSSPPLIFAGRRGSEGVYVAGESEPLTSLYSYGGFISPEGDVFVLGWDTEDREIRLVQRKKGEKPRSTTLRPNFRVGNYFYNAGLLWDQVLVRGVTPDNQRRLFSLPLDGKTSDFSLVDVGELVEAGLIRRGEEEQTHISGCRTNKATIVRVRGGNNDFITFRIGQKFSMPVFGPTWGTLGCYGTTATLATAAYAKAGTKIYHSACTSAGCNTREFKSNAIDRDAQAMIPSDARNIQVVDLLGKILVVWRAGERGGLRMRLASPDEFEVQPDVVVFDDLVADGKLSDMSSILGFRLYSREDFAALLLSTMSGLHAFRISPDGEIAPFEVTK